MPFSSRKKTPSDHSKTGKRPGYFRKYPWLIWLFPVIGLASLIWFLIRVVPKPSRATYPCQRIAFPLASSFIIWLFGLGGSTLAFRKARSSFYRSHYIVGILCIVVSIGCVWLSLSLTVEKEAEAADPHPVNSPVGVARGIHPGRVVWVHDPNATDWEGWDLSDEYWWQSNHTDQDVVDSMMERAVCAVAGERDIWEAWDRIFRYFNQQQGKGDRGYRYGEDIMIKVNFVDMIAIWGDSDYDFVDHTPDYAICSPQIMYALIDQLVNVVGAAESDITIGDPICLWCNEFYNMIQPDFPNVRFLDYLGYYGRTEITYSSVPFYWSTSKADGMTQDYVLQSYVDAEYFINLASLKGHYNQAGITVCAKNHFGSLRGPTASGYYNMHLDTPFIVPESGSYRDMVDLMGHRDVGGKTLLCLIDGLYTGKHAISYPENLPKKWQMEPFNYDWCSSIFASQDQVAIDSVAFDFLVTEWPEAGGPAHEGTDDYLHEAALVDNPPSNAFYDPERDGTRLTSLGVHEHWNNPIDKQYSRNLGTGDGIQLWQGPPVSDVDFSGDGKVDLKDFAILAQYLSSNDASIDVAPPPFGDGVVDNKDLGVFVENYLTATVIPPLPEQAGNPNPPDGAVDVNTTIILSWAPGSGAVSHDVYIGSDYPPPFICNQIAPMFNIVWLLEGTKFYWRIDEINGWGKTRGTVWSFTTTDDPPPPPPPPPPP
jgi:hypothetical protein